MIFLLVLICSIFNFCFGMDVDDSDKWHTSMATMIVEIYSAKTLKADDKVLCHLCDSAKLRHDHLRLHLHDSARYYCKRCGVGHVQSSNLKSHEDGPMHKALPSHECRLCGDMVVDLDKHMYFHEEELARYLASVVDEKPDWRD